MIMNKYEELQKLKELLDTGVLSQEEFEAKKKKILSGVDNTAPKTQKKKFIIAILVTLTVLVFGCYLYSGTFKAIQTDISYKESVDGITIGKDYDTVFEYAKNDSESKKQVIGWSISDDKSEIMGLPHKDYRGVAFNVVDFHFSSGVVSSIKLRKMANQYDGDAAKIIQEAYDRIEASLRKENFSYQETDEGVMFCNENEKIIINQEQVFPDDYELNVKIEKK